MCAVYPFLAYAYILSKRANFKVWVLIVDNLDVKRNYLLLELYGNLHLHKMENLLDINDLKSLLVYVSMNTVFSPRCSSEMTSRYCISDFPSGFTLAAREISCIACSAEPAGVHGNTPLKKHCIDYKPLTARG